MRKVILLFLLLFLNCITSGTILPEWKDRQVSELKRHPIFGNEEFEIKTNPDKSQFINYSITHFKAKVYHKEQVGYLQNSGTVSYDKGKATEITNEPKVSSKKEHGFMFYIFAYLVYSKCGYHFLTKEDKIIEARFFGYEFACDDREDILPSPIPMKSKKK